MKPKRTSNHRAGKQESAAQRRVDALELRKSGASFRTIANALGVSVAQAFKDVDTSLAELRKLEGESAETMRRLDLERIDGLLLGHYAPAAQGDYKSARIVLAALDRRAKLLGLDSPEKREDGPSLLDQYLAAKYPANRTSP